MPDVYKYEEEKDIVDYKYKIVFYINPSTGS